MIVTYKENGWDVILQRHHGKIAATLLNQLTWVKDDQRKLDLLLATAEHDDSANEFEKSNLITKTGGPIDFHMEMFSEELCDRLMKQAFTRGLFIVLLISCHIQFLYDGASPEATAYCRRLQLFQREWRRQLDVTEAAMRRYYTILQWCDAFSLILCQQQIPPEGRKLEISKGPEGESFSLFSLSDENYLSVEPWPFVSPSFTLNLEIRTLTSLSFKSDRQFLDELWAAPLSIRSITICKNS
ncbi:DUF3891 family protein [Olivibacter sp. XZL3]|uniref:DUF3891 family protein n=1 Tax=Olivibacter sp. XZL3 TaxID=1735116 RepID=UPI001065A441|nr:DUF3891 family protein [Olivibacter sp. XZL3]